MGVALAAGCSSGSRMQATDGTPQVTPGAEDFGLVGVRWKVPGALKLTNGGRAPLSVTGLRLEGAGASEYSIGALAKDRLALAESVPLPLVFHPSKVGESDAVLVIATDSTNTPELRVNLAGRAIVAQARLSASAMNFGRIELQSTRGLPFTVVNDSVLPVTVELTPQGRDGDQFAAGGPMQILAGESAQVEVSFSPTRLGALQGALGVALCQGCPPEPVALTGVGLDSAIVFAPPYLDFGSHDVERRSAPQALSAKNISDLPVAIQRFGLSEGSDPGYSVTPEIPPTVLGPGQSVEIKATLQALHLGSAGSFIELHSDSPRWPVRRVSLDGAGGDPEVGVSPVTIDFGPHTVGSKTPVSIRIQNNGGGPEGLQVQEILVEGDPCFSAAAPALPISLAPGAHADVPILFAPTSSGGFQGFVMVTTNDAASPVLRVMLSGSAQAALPCEVQVLPPRITFGNVPPGLGAVLGFKVVNVGRDVCAVKDLTVSDDGGGRFALVGTPPPGIELLPGEGLVREVSFRSDSVGEFPGEITFTVADPAAPLRHLRLLASALPSCVELAPRFLDWGYLRGDCGVPPKTVAVKNSCPASVGVRDVRVGEGTADDFEVAAAPALPARLAPGASMEVSVRYDAQVVGQTIAPLFVTLDELARPLLVPLLGESWRTGSLSDEFIQQAPDQLDVLFVVDNSGSMVEDQPRLRAAIPALVAALQSSHRDAHLAVTSAGIEPSTESDCPGGARGGEAGRLFPVDGSAPRFFDMATPDLAGQLGSATQVGFCHYLEQPLEAARRALSSPLVDSADDPRTPQTRDGNLGFYRDAAALGLVFLTDGDDHSTADVGRYAAFFRELKGAQQPERLRVLAIAPGMAAPCATEESFPAPRLSAFADQTGGELFSVCNEDYAPALTRLVQAATTPQASFVLSSHPDARGVAVRVDGAEAGGWTYDAAANAIRFDAGSVPRPGAHITASYTVQCEQ